MDYANAMDSLDHGIVSLLQQDGRMAFREMARRLEVSEGTIRRRYNAMVQGGVFQVSLTGDPTKLGVKVDAITLVKTEPLKAESAATVIAQFQNVRFVGLGMGPADIVVESLHSSTDELYSFITQTLPTVDGVLSCDTIQIVKILKSIWDWQAWLKQYPKDRETVGA
jgi:Lrp/AsnC family transcriptional regulator for asnA, asnC and gidA